MTVTTTQQELPSQGMSTHESTTADETHLAAPSIGRLLRRIHRDERGAVSIETILIIAAIAIPILIFIIKFGWPRIKTWFNQGMEELEGGMDDAAGA
ncbi:MAG: hypothetical protein H6823_12170 [Planctomycetaceae bacterium]|nr:hypothetical protein [Planctomycetales bacterium]MCB9938993.1 hypothetical protein [Planctomycetaceae bacterium]